MQLMTRTPGLVKLGDVGMQADNPAIRQPLMLNVNPAVARLADLAVVRLAAVADNRLAQRLLPAWVDVVSGIDKLLRQALKRGADGEPGRDRWIKQRHLIIPGLQSFALIVDHHRRGQEVKVVTVSGMHDYWPTV